MGCSGLMGKCEQERCISTDYDTDSSLIILGNGFDLHHDLETSYSDYRKWLKVHDKQVVTDFDSFIYAVECSDFENSLGCMRGSAKEDNPRWSSLEESLGIEWDDLCYETLEHTYPNLYDDNPGWDDFWIELQVRLEYMKKLTRDRFREWVESIDVSKEKLFLIYRTLLRSLPLITPQRWSMSMVFVQIESSISMVASWIKTSFFNLALPTIILSSFRRCLKTNMEWMIFTVRLFSRV